MVSFKQSVYRLLAVAQFLLQKLAGAGWFWSLVLFVLPLAGLGVWWVDDKPFTIREKKWLVYLFLCLILGVVVVLLLLRNAVVANTAFIIRLRDQLQKHGKSLTGLENELKHRHRSEQQLSKRLNELTDALRKTTTGKGPSRPA